MRALCLLAFCCLSQILSAQVIDLNKKRLERILKGAGEEKEMIADSAEWQACEPNYWRSDTIRFYNHKYYYLWNKDSCCTVEWWTFDQKKRLYSGTGYYCDEPPVSEVRERKDLKISKDKGELYISISDRKKRTEKFKVIKLERTNVPGSPRPVLVLTLTRM